MLLLLFSKEIPKRTMKNERVTMVLWRRQKSLRSKHSHEAEWFLVLYAAKSYNSECSIHFIYNISIYSSVTVSIANLFSRVRKAGLRNGGHRVHKNERKSLPITDKYDTLHFFTPGYGFMRQNGKVSAWDWIYCQRKHENRHLLILCFENNYPQLYENDQIKPSLVKKCLACICIWKIVF